MKLSEYKYDSIKEEQGVWFENSEGLKLKIARAGNPKAAALTRKLGVENQRRLRRTNNADLVDDLAKQVVAKHILLDWDNLEDDDGKPIQHTSAKALEFFREYNDFYLEVMEYASRDDEYRESIVDEAVKN